MKISDLLDLESILELTGTKDKVIDVFKMDIEGPEKCFFDNLNMTYACKYFKQMVFETHMNMEFEELIKLEDCFYLFRRDTRFFEYFKKHPKLGYLTEFQAPNGFRIDVAKFKNETNLAEFMFVNGELYFVNKNFL